MQINQAKQILLKDLIERLGGKYARTTNGEEWYHSPFRPNERTPSFKVNLKANLWYDFGHSNKGGDIIDLWCDYHGLDRKTGVKEALKGLASLLNPLAAHKWEIVQPQQQAEKPHTVERYRITKLYPRIFNAGLLEELQRRKISTTLAAHYLKQAHISDAQMPQRKLIGFAFGNEKGGYEISIPNPQGKSFKTSIGGKSYTRVQGKGASQVDIFEGFWDFLTYLQMNKITAPDNDVYVLNSLSFCRAIADLIIQRKEEIKLVKSFLDNDEAGQKATTLLIDQFAVHDIMFDTMEHLYKGCKDLNEWWFTK